jgi:hypothetical protein
MQRHEPLRPQSQALKTEQLCWRDRRLWAYLRCIQPQLVNQQRIWRLMREHRLLVPPNLRLKAHRPPPGSTPKRPRPQEWGGSDMLKVLVEGCRWISSVRVLDG